MHSNAAEDAVEFAAYLVKTCVIDDAGVSNTEFYNVIEALGKVGYYSYALLVLKGCVAGW
jgi:CCR4-NOT transcription complex subunit 1